MSTLAVLAGALGGLGLLGVVTAFLRRPTPRSLEEEVLLAEGSRRSPRDALRRLIEWGRRQLQGDAALVQDARMVGRSLETQAVAKFAGALLGGLVLGVGGGLGLGLTGISMPAAVVVLLAVLGAGVGWWLPDSMLRTEAAKQRVAFQRSAEAWLELAGQLVTAGADPFSALTTAASYSEQPTFVVLHDALRVSAARGEPPWTGLRRLADERRLRFLDPFCASFEMAGTTGAGSRETILSQVEAARSKAMHEADAAAASSGEKMGAPLALIGGAFMVIMGYPPLAGIMDSASLTGPGL
ncbi:MAG: type II secretion system F family protein [bacterium]|nr:type II secretion system F family protein [bacterium]